MQRETQIERARAALDLAQKQLTQARNLKRSGAIAAAPLSFVPNEKTARQSHAGSIRGCASARQRLATCTELCPRTPSTYAVSATPSA